MKRIFDLNVNGFAQQAEISTNDLKMVIDPLINDLCSQKERTNGKLIVFLAGMPGAGKSTLALMIEARARELECPFKFRALGLDGFHYPQKVLDNAYATIDGKRVCLATRKGCPETFDCARFTDFLRSAQTESEAFWPVYDRRAHDVLGEVIKVEGDILLVEGNWLLLNDERWATAREYCALTIQLETKPEEVRPRLIARKMRGGKTLKEAEAWYDTVDGPNCERFLMESVPAQKKIRLEMA